MSPQNERRSGLNFLTLLGLAMAGLWLTACSTTTQGASHLVAHEITAPPVGAFTFCMENRQACGLPAQEETLAVKDMSKSAPTGTADPVAAAPEPELTDAQLMAMARVVNALINTSITYRSDEMSWDMQERWVLPISAEGVRYGDCEDYALEKRVALLAAGAPADRMSMATAWSPGTGVHAVLILRLEAGDYVLDNITPHILTVGETVYEWRSLQTGPTLLEWSSVSNALPQETTGQYTAG